MDSTQILSTVALITSIGGVIFATINHTRVRSGCCGKKLEISIDVDKTTPTAVAPILPAAPVLS